MTKVFDALTSKERDFLVKEENLLEVLRMIQIGLSNGMIGSLMELKVNKHLFEKTKELVVYDLTVQLTKNQWRSLLILCKDKKYKLLMDDAEDKNRLLFVKHEESK